MGFWDEFLGGFLGELILLEVLKEFFEGIISGITSALHILFSAGNVQTIIGYAMTALLFIVASPFVLFFTLQIFFIFMSLYQIKEQFPLITYVSLNIALMVAVWTIFRHIIEIFYQIIVSLTTWIP